MTSRRHWHVDSVAVKLGPVLAERHRYAHRPDETVWDELIELNRRIVERLQLLRSAKRLAQLARFSVGMLVEFDTDDGRTVKGTVARLNRQTATVVAESGRWRVSPSLLRPVEPALASSSSRSRIVTLQPLRTK